jgi:hypothetical protein
MQEAICPLFGVSVSTVSDIVRAWGYFLDDSWMPMFLTTTKSQIFDPILLKSLEPSVMPACGTSETEAQILCMKMGHVAMYSE